MKHLIIFSAVIFALSACSSHDNNGVSGLTPFPERTDLKDEKLEEAITAYIQNKGAPANSTYDFIRTDLNGDRNREGIALFKLPHTYWCGRDGCEMVIFKAGQHNFTPLSTINNVRGPIYIDRTNLKQWNNIIVRLSGTSMKDKNVILENNGSGYSTTPLLAPTLHRNLTSISVDTFFR